MVLVLENGVVVGIHTNSIGEHLLLVIKKGVSAEIVSEVNTLVNDSGAAAVDASDTISGDAGRRASHFTRSRNQGKKGRRWGFYSILRATLLSPCTWSPPPKAFHQPTNVQIIMFHLVKENNKIYIFEREQ